MRRVAYIGELSDRFVVNNSFSKEIMSVLNTSRNYSKSHKITGVILIFEKIILQYCEGEKSDIAKLLYVLKKEHVIQNFSVVLNRDYNERLFPEWTIRLFAPGMNHYNHSVSQIYANCAGAFQFTSSVSKSHFQMMIDKAKNSSASNPQLKSVGKSQLQKTKNLAKIRPTAFYQDKVLNMHTWPKPTQVNQTGDLISLCSYLVGKHRHYNELIELKVCGDEQNLKMNLGVLDELGMLNTDISGAQAKSRINQGSAKDKLSQALTKFIAASRSK